MTKEVWAGEFGNKYHSRNRVDWRIRTPFWRGIMGITGARSVYEIGCGPGWNLSAIKRDYSNVNVSGEDVNDNALDQAFAAGLDVYPADYGHHCTAELVFTAGVLIHIPPEELPTMMQRIIDISTDYVLAVEYNSISGEEEPVTYQGQEGLLWRRNYGALYQNMGLELVALGDAGEGFDNCTYWLLRKP